MKKAELEKLKFSTSKDGNLYLEFESPIGISIGGFNHYQGEFESTMELYVTQGDARNGCGGIEWDVPRLGEVTQIGVWWKNGKATDYDGLADEMPWQAKELLKRFGLKVPKDF